MYTGLGAGETVNPETSTATDEKEQKPPLPLAKGPGKEQQDRKLLDK